MKNIFSKLKLKNAFSFNELIVLAATEQNYIKSVFVVLNK